MWGRCPWKYWLFQLSDRMIQTKLRETRVNKVFCSSVSLNSKKNKCFSTGKTTILQLLRSVWISLKGDMKKNKRKQVKYWQIGWWKMTQTRGGRKCRFWYGETLIFPSHSMAPLQLPVTSCSIVQDAGCMYRKLALCFLSPSCYGRNVWI